RRAAVSAARRQGAHRRAAQAARRSGAARSAGHARARKSALRLRVEAPRADHPRHPSRGGGVNRYARDMPTAPASFKQRLVRGAAEWLAPRDMLVLRGPHDRRRVSLTFDDGPEDNLPKYLDALERAGASATFFLLGECCARRRDG